MRNLQSFITYSLLFWFFVFVLVSIIFFYIHNEYIIFKFELKVEFKFECAQARNNFRQINECHEPRAMGHDAEMGKQANDIPTFCYHKI